jgi:HSP20 family protein
MTRWDLFREMDSMSREMENILGNLGIGRAIEPGLVSPFALRNYPRIEVREEAERFTVTALLPGIEPQALEMTVLGNTLTLSGERKTEAPQGVTWHRRERGAGKFLRTIDLPAEIDADQVKADFANGVLTVALPKAAAAKPKRIAIAAS